MIELKNLSFSYENSSEAKGQLRGIDLHVKKGELVILSGRSGCLLCCFCLWKQLCPVLCHYIKETLQ